MSEESVKARYNLIYKDDNKRQALYNAIINDPECPTSKPFRNLLKTYILVPDDNRTSQRKEPMNFHGALTQMFRRGLSRYDVDTLFQLMDKHLPSDNEILRDSRRFTGNRSINRSRRRSRSRNSNHNINNSRTKYSSRPHPDLRREDNLEKTVTQMFRELPDDDRIHLYSKLVARPNYPKSIETMHFNPITRRHDIGNTYTQFMIRSRYVTDNQGNRIINPEWQELNTITAVLLKNGADPSDIPILYRLMYDIMKNELNRPIPKDLSNLRPIKMAVVNSYGNIRVSEPPMFFGQQEQTQPQGQQPQQQQQQQQQQRAPVFTNPVDNAASVASITIKSDTIDIIDQEGFTNGESIVMLDNNPLFVFRVDTIMNWFEVSRGNKNPHTGLPITSIVIGPANIVTSGGKKRKTRRARKYHH